MIEVFRQMLVGVTAAAILAGVSLQFVKEGPLHEAVRVAAGLMLTLALLLPFSRLPGARMAFSEAVSGLQGAAARAAAENQRIAASSVGNAVAIYIEDRAADMGVKCTAAVCMGGDENGQLETKSVTLYIEGATEEERSAVCQMVAQECGIPIYLMEVKGK